MPRRVASSPEQMACIATALGCVSVLVGLAASARRAVSCVFPTAENESSVRTSVDSGCRLRRSRLSGSSASGISRRMRMTMSLMASNTDWIARPTPRKKSTTGCRKLMMPSAMDWKIPVNQRQMPTKNCPTPRKKLPMDSTAPAMAFGSVSVNQR